MGTKTGNIGIIIDIYACKWPVSLFDVCGHLAAGDTGQPHSGVNLSKISFGETATLGGQPHCLHNVAQGLMLILIDIGRAAFRFGHECAIPCLDADTAMGAAAINTQYKPALHVVFLYHLSRSAPAHAVLPVKSVGDLASAHQQGVGHKI